MTIDRFSRIRRAMEEIRAGRMIILVDDEDRENEGDLTMAADRITPEAINFMARHGRGLICLTLTEERVAQLGLAPQTSPHEARYRTAFHVAIDARQGVATGISAADRAHTIRVATAPDARPDDVVPAGHVMTIRARKGGVLVRSGHTEGSVDLARLAGCAPAGVICEVMNEDGTMARLPDLEKFAEAHGLLIVTIAELIEYRLQHDRLVRRTGEATVVPGIAEFDTAVRALTYGTDVDTAEYLALVVGDIDPSAPTLVRVQSICIPGDVFGARSCDCHTQMREALRAMRREGRGVFLYVCQGRPHLLSDVRSHVLHQGAPREPKLLEYGLGAQVLADLGLRKIRLMTNNPRKIVGLEGFGLDVVERVPTEAAATEENAELLRQKRQMGHLLALDGKK